MSARSQLINGRVSCVRQREIWRQIWSNNPNERLNREIRRRYLGLDILTRAQAITTTAIEEVEQPDLQALTV